MGGEKPTPFLTVRVQDLDDEPSLTALCAGYELKCWRCDDLADHLMEWLPEFALNWREAQRFSMGNAVTLIRKAARSIYKTEKYRRRGEFGEILLHAALRQVFDSEPAISKLYYKDSANDTVKGFDAVHVVGSEHELQLWLGEVKFYKDKSKAIADVVKELQDHTDRDYLRAEFSLITNKLDEDWPHYQRVRRLLDEKTSLDEVFDSVAIPVLLTYNSDCLAAHESVTDEYLAAFAEEVRAVRNSFSAKELPDKLTVHLILVPLHTKEQLVEALHERLKQWQA